MSDFMLRSLAAACAPRIAAKVEAAVLATVRDELPGTIEAVLREQFPGETLRMYIPKKPVTLKRDRNAAIRAQYNGHNVKALSTSFGLSPSMIFKIVACR